jgi:hypothetical protein
VTSSKNQSIVAAGERSNVKRTQQTSRVQPLINRPRNGTNAAARSGAATASTDADADG